MSWVTIAVARWPEQARTEFEERVAIMLEGAPPDPEPGLAQEQVEVEAYHLVAARMAASGVPVPPPEGLDP